MCCLIVFDEYCTYCHMINNFWFLLVWLKHSLKYHCIASFGADGDSDVILKEFYDYVQENYDEIISNTTFKNTIDMGKYILN